MRRFLVVPLIACLAAALVACGSLGSAAPGPAQAPREKEYRSTGQDTSLLEALNAAKRDAVRRAVIERIGETAERANRGVLEDALYAAGRLNAFIVRHALETTGKVKDDYVVEGTVVVNTEAVSAALESRGLLAGTTEGGRAEGGAGTAAPEGSQAASLTPAQSRLVADYVGGLTWMVYFSEGSGIDPATMKAAVAVANLYLTQKSLDTVSAEQVEKLKADQRKVYEEETGESITITQWIAQKLSADVYIEIAGAVSGGKSGAGAWAQANITLDIFEASTATLLASVPWNSPKVANTTDEAARINAVQASVDKAMPEAVRTATEKMAASARANGIRYELVIQRTPDTRAMSALRTRLRETAREVKLLSQSDEETRMRVSLLGTAEDLADSVLEASARIAGLAGMRLVLLRGKSLTFDTGR